MGRCGRSPTTIEYWTCPLGGTWQQHATTGDAPTTIGIVATVVESRGTLVAWCGAHGHDDAGDDATADVACWTSRRWYGARVRGWRPTTWCHLRAACRRPICYRMVTLRCWLSIALAYRRKYGRCNGRNALRSTGHDGPLRRDAAPDAGHRHAHRGAAAASGQARAILGGRVQQAHQHGVGRAARLCLRRGLGSTRPRMALGARLWAI
jgi:hypothetical protein